MAYECSYGGVPFNLDIPDLLALIDQQLPLWNLQELLPPPFALSRKVCDLVPNRWPEYQFLRIGEYCYPSGATRWSVFHGLASTTQAQQMVRLAQNQGRAYPFPFKLQADLQSPPVQAGKPHAIETPLFLLPPRPVGHHPASSHDAVWLITLVDERYFWQYGGVADVTLCTGTPNPTPVQSPGQSGQGAGPPFQQQPLQGPVSTWKDLLDLIARALGITLMFPAQLPLIYLTPEPDSQLFSRYENAALLLDVVAANVGRVVVREGLNQYALLSPSEAAQRVVQNRPESQMVRLAGGPVSGPPYPSAGAQAVLPRSVRVCFPRYVNRDPQTDSQAIGPPYFVNDRYTASPWSTSWAEEAWGSVYSKQVKLADVGQPESVFQGAPCEKIIFTTAKAFLNAEDDTAPQNQAVLDGLATQLAKDFWDWQLAPGLDEVYPSIVPWQPDGIHDIIWTYRAGQVSTRVLRRPWNFQWSEFQHCATALLSSTPNYTPGGSQGSYNYSPTNLPSSGFSSQGAESVIVPR